MPWETRDNTGSLFRNNRKGDDPETASWADYAGECKIDGVDYWMDGWLKESSKGTKWMSFSFKRKDKQSNDKPKLKVVEGGGKPPYDDEIPF